MRIIDQALDDAGHGLPAGYDIGLQWNPRSQGIGIRPDATGDIDGSRDIVTLILLQLCTCRRAEYGDRLPDGQTDRRGWVSDHAAPEGITRWGARFWLLGDALANGKTAAEMRSMALEALNPLINPLGLARRVEVDSRRSDVNRIDLVCSIYRQASGLPRRSFDLPWGQVTILS